MISFNAKTLALGLMLISFFIGQSELHANLACKDIRWDKRISLKGSDFSSLLPGVPKSEEGFVTTVNQVPLNSKNILKAYELGMFPWNPESTGVVSWYNPSKHGIVEIEPLIHRTGKKFKNHRAALNKVVNNGWYITYNRAFNRVIKKCADHDRSNYSHVWLVPEVQHAYMKLHKEGKAHSVEVWDSNGNLIGGTYGIYQKGMFSAESMFHEVSDAGKVAVLALLTALHKSGHKYLDTQTVNDNTRSNYHAYLIPRKEYLSRLHSEEVRIGEKDGRSVFDSSFVYSVLEKNGDFVQVENYK